MDLCRAVLPLNCNVQLDHRISECNFELEDEYVEFSTQLRGETGLVHSFERFNRVLNYLNIIKQVHKLLNCGYHFILNTLSLTEFRYNLYF